MQIALRSQMIAGATALVGATAIALTPIAPAASLPALSTSKAAVELAALANPINALLATGGTVVQYLLSSDATGPDGASAAVNWPGSQISDAINIAVRPNGGVLTSGLIPNILANPFPAATQLLSNWLGYAGIAINSGAAVLGAASTIAWLPVSVAGTIVSDILAGTPGLIPQDVSNAVNLAIATATSATQLAIAGVTSIVNGIVTRGSAVLTALSSSLSQSPELIQLQIAALTTTISNVVSNVSTGYATGGLSGAWNAGVVGLLSTVAPVGSGYTGLTLPGTVVNLTEGAGVQTSAADPNSWVPSVRAVGTGLATTIAGALATTVPGPVPVAAGRPAAAKSAAAAPAAAKKAGAGVGRHAAAKAAAAK
ncbi:MAG: hypothetical protein ACR2JI_16130 [Mycobacterium sp.]